MARTDSLSNFLTDVASAIKTKKGSETSIPAANFDTEILAIPVRGQYQTKIVNISQNGSTIVTPDAGYDAIEGIEIIVAIPETPLQTKTVQITSNGNITVLPDTGYEGMTQVGLEVAVPGQTINNQDKTITQNGTYTADSGYTGIGTATVNVHDPVKLYSTQQELQADLSTRNIGDKGIVWVPVQRNPGKKDIFNKIYIPHEFTVDGTTMTEDWYATWLCYLDPTVQGDEDFNRVSMTKDFADIRFSNESASIHFQAFFSATDNGDGTYTYTCMENEGWHDLGTAVYITNDIVHTSSGDAPFHENLLRMFEIDTGNLDSLWRCEEVADTTKARLYMTEDITVDNSGQITIGTEHCVDYLCTNISACITVAQTVNSRFGYLVKINNKFYATFLARTTKNGTWYNSPDFIWYNNRWYLGTGQSLALTSCVLHLLEVNLDTGAIIGSDTTYNGTILSLSGTNQDCIFENINPQCLPIYVSNSDTVSTAYCHNYNVSPYASEYIYGAYGVKLQWNPLPLQFNATAANQVLNEYSVLGYAGAITGDGSIYTNLDNNIVNSNIFNLPVWTAFQDTDYSDSPLPLYGKTNDFCLASECAKGQLTYGKYDTAGTVLIGKYAVSKSSLTYPSWFSNTCVSHGKITDTIYYEYCYNSSDSTAWIKFGNTEEVLLNLPLTYNGYSSATILTTNNNGNFYYSTVSGTTSYLVCKVDLSTLTKTDIFNFSHTTSYSAQLSADNMNDEFLCVMFSETTAVTSSRYTIRKIGKIYDFSTGTIYNVFDITKSDTRSYLYYRMSFQTKDNIYFGPVFERYSSSYTNRTDLMQFNKATKQITTILNNCTSTTTSYATLTDGPNSIGIENNTYIWFEGYATSIEINKTNNTYRTISAGSSYQLYNYNLHLGTNGFIWAMNRGKTIFYEVTIDGLEITVLKSFTIPYKFGYGVNNYSSEQYYRTQNQVITTASTIEKVTTGYVVNSQLLNIVKTNNVDINDCDVIFTEGNLSMKTNLPIHNLALLYDNFEY